MSDQPDITPADPDTGASSTPSRKDLMSEANYSKLQSDYDKLRRRYSEVKKERDTLKTEVTTLTAKATELQELLEVDEEAIAQVIAEKVAEVEVERDRFREMAEQSPDQWKAKYEELNEQIRVRSHQDKFNEAAKAAGVLPEALADAWSLSGYKPEGDQPDAALIQSSVEGLLQSRPWLKAGIAADAAKASPDGRSAAPDGASPAPPPTSKGKGPGLDRGASPSGSQANVLRATRAQVADAAWMTANADAIRAATAAGAFSIADA